MNNLQFPNLFYRLVELTYTEHVPQKQQQLVLSEDYYRIFITTGGDGRLVLGGRGYWLERGKCFIAEPGITLSSEAGKSGLHYYELSFEILQFEKNGLHASEEPLKISFPCVGEVECSPFSQCLEWVEALYRHSMSDTSDQLEWLDQHIRFQELLRHILRQNLQASRPPTIRQAVESTIELMRQDYGEEWTVGRMAETANIGRWQYTRVFKEITGQVPLQYLSGIRVDQAKHLLQVTDDRLLDIAHNVGFGNEYYFNRRFKQTVGLSPGQYRRHYQEDIRIFAPFLEDFLLALGLTPVLQVSVSRWGRQAYLGLDHVPSVEVSSSHQAPLPCKPDFIIVDHGFASQWDCNSLENEASLFRMPNQGEDWQESLRTIADLLGRGRSVKVAEVISNYERKAERARQALRYIRHQTVAFLRISSNEVYLYAGPDKGYTGPILHKDLELTPHPLVQQLNKNTRLAVLTPEWLAQLDADHLFITFENGEQRGNVMLNTPAWKSLPAVRHNRVYEVDFLSWMNYGILAHGKKIDDVLRALA